MRRVIIESPFRHVDPSIKVEYNRYLHRAMLDSILRGEAPFASHALYPQILDDDNRYDRESGMRCGFEWMEAADLVAVYMDYGVSPGMMRGIAEAKKQLIPIETRSIGGNPG